MPVVASPARPRPFLKWAGGKRQLLSQLRPFIPADFGHYYEPFLGGGALFFDLVPARATLSDTNERLIRTYRAIRDKVNDVIEILKHYRHDKDVFLALRRKDIDKAGDVEVAAWMVYLNRTAYNGLYRVNKRNVFNTPFGDYDAPRICDPVNLRACSKALRGMTLETRSFEQVGDVAELGDFVYFDPPYVPLGPSASFTSYTAAGFDSRAQRR